jgi:hypothetical protein
MLVPRGQRIVVARGPLTCRLPEFRAGAEWMPWSPSGPARREAGALTSGIIADVTEA